MPRIKIQERGNRRKRCDGQTMKGTRCTFSATTFSNLGNYCRSHIPVELDKHSKAHTQSLRRHQLRKQEKTIGRMKELFKSLEPFRRVPPPEEVAIPLLRKIQSGQCFMCLMHGKSVEQQDLVLDHCHDTGMIRALLCKSCNTQEWTSGDSEWEAYRKYAPANGWYCRYFGWNAQWLRDEPDVLSKRIKLSDIGLKFEDIEGVNTGDLLKIYIKKTASLKPTRKTSACDLRFYDGARPPLFEHEIRKLKQDIAKRCVEVMKNIDMGD